MAISSRKSIKVLLLSGGILVLSLSSFSKVHSRGVNLLFIGSLVVIWAILLNHFWKTKTVRLALLCIPGLLLVPFLLPKREINPDTLHSAYLVNLKSYESSPYYWGGESSRGIDCSGLPRRAFRDALLKEGFRNLNGSAFRAYAEHWWFDASAKALGSGYRDYTFPSGNSGTIHTLDYTQLKPGDMATTTNGVHVIVYLGDERWIQADPMAGSVIIRRGKIDDNAWFDSPVTVHRWKKLEMDSFG